MDWKIQGAEAQKKAKCTMPGMPKIDTAISFKIHGVD